MIDVPTAGRFSDGWKIHPFYIEQGYACPLATAAGRPLRHLTNYSVIRTGTRCQTTALQDLCFSALVNQSNHL
jgi:hypothetical protein